MTSRPTTRSMSNKARLKQRPGRKVPEKAVPNLEVLRGIFWNIQKDTTELIGISWPKDPEGKVKAEYRTQYGTQADALILLFGEAANAGEPVLFQRLLGDPQGGLLERSLRLIKALRTDVEARIGRMWLRKPSLTVWQSEALERDWSREELTITLQGSLLSADQESSRRTSETPSGTASDRASAVTIEGATNAATSVVTKPPAENKEEEPLQYTAKIAAAIKELWSKQRATPDPAPNTPEQEEKVKLCQAAYRKLLQEAGDLTVQIRYLGGGTVDSLEWGKLLTKVQKDQLIEINHDAHFARREITIAVRTCDGNFQETSHAVGYLEMMVGYESDGLIHLFNTMNVELYEALSLNGTLGAYRLLADRSDIEAVVGKKVYPLPRDPGPPDQRYFEALWRYRKGLEGGEESDDEEEGTGASHQLATEARVTEGMAISVADATVESVPPFEFDSAFPALTQDSMMNPSVRQTSGSGWSSNNPYVGTIADAGVPG